LRAPKNDTTCLVFWSRATGSWPDFFRLKLAAIFLRADAHAKAADLAGIWNQPEKLLHENKF
jgi:hypothetical protein